MNHLNDPEQAVRGLEPQDLDGHTVEELYDYLDAGKTPVNQSIEDSPGCLMAMDSIQRLGVLTSQMFKSDTDSEPAADESWVQRILGSVAREVRSGREIPLLVPEVDDELTITEGALRAAVRAAEQDAPGLLVLRCRFDGDVTEPDEPILVRVQIAVAYGVPIPDAANTLRAGIVEQLTRHSTLVINGIDISVEDVYLPAPKQGNEDE